MDIQKSAASRVRHILQAMERSIDSARSRRMHDHETPAAAHNAPSPGVRPSSSASSPLAQSNASIPTQPRLAIPAAPAAALHPGAARDSGALIGGNPGAARLPPAPVDPTQPVRLKAKPKRFESTFAAQFAQPTQPAYRSQAG